MVTVKTNAPLPQIDFSQANFATINLYNEIESCVLNDNFEELKDLLHSCSKYELAALQQSKTLDELLKSILEVPDPSDAAKERAYRLALEMERVGISPIWAKIARAIVYSGPGGEDVYTLLINQMIFYDNQPNTTLEHRAHLLNLADEFMLEGKHEMHSKIKQILNQYNRITAGAIKPLSSDFLLLVGHYLFV